MGMMAEASPEGAGRHRDAVRRFLLRLVRDEALAEDLVQEVFLRAQRTRSPHRGGASERSWLCAIGLNLVRDHYRASSRNPAAANESDACDRLSCDADEDPEKQVMEAEMTDCIAEFVVQLPRPQCDVVALHDAGGLTHAEIAALLDVSEANSRVILHRGRKALRALLEEGCVLSFDSDGTPCERRPPGDGKGSFSS
jgi:RNA polymerase sigma-70 factor (ECF subfamily)